MKKRLLLDRPYVGDRGQYTFFDDASTDYLDSNGIPQNYDKFSDKDLYSVSQDDTINNYIVENKLRFVSTSYVRVNEFTVVNSGVKYKVKNSQIKAWMFDGKSLNSWLFEKYGDVDENAIANPTTLSYTRLSELPNRFKFFQFSSKGKKKKGYSPGTLLENAEIMTDISTDTPTKEIYFGDVDGQWSPDLAFTQALEDAGTTGIFDPDADNQTIYVVVWMKGDAKRWWGTDKRKKRVQIFEIPASELFTDDTTPTGKITVLPFDYGDSVKKEGGGGSGGAESPAFKVSKLSFTINTAGSSDYEEGEVFSEEVTQILGSVIEPKLLDLQNLEESFILQSPSSEVNNIVVSSDTGYLNDVQKNFEAVPKVGILNQDYELQAYQTSSIDRQICSAPTEISLDYYISDFDVQDAELQEETPSYDNLGYKFLVLDWDDNRNKLKDPIDYMSDIPRNTKDLIRKRENNTYYFSDIGTPLIHGYSTPGIKTIKSILFSHTIDDFTQIVRWKFVKTRLFLDIPTSEYPDFASFGGNDYTTIPWPYTTPVIGGVDENSKYSLSIQNTLRGGSIGDTDVIDERFLLEAQENDELGKSILEFDLEQIRYFNDSYSMAELLDISLENNETFTPHTSEYWNGLTEETSFPENSSVGKIFISDTLDQELIDDCQFELNTGEVEYNSIYDSNGKSNKGILLGDYKIKKQKKGTPMRRDSSIKFPKKSNNSNGAL